MIRENVRRFVTGAVLAVLAVTTLLVGPGPALADDAKPTAVILSGDDLEDSVEITEEDGDELFSAMLSQVSWLTGESGRAAVPDRSKLGPKYTVVIRYGDKDRYSYDLYPLAEGGPRAFRPGEQPDGRATEAWFFGRLNMPNALRLAGAPLPETTDVMTGGIGGGERINEQQAVDPAGDLFAGMGGLRGMLAVNAGVLLLITGGLAGIAFLARRR
ncbi:hypothetical protein J2S43_000255 [Catenuloplanes nepalensis]|uniref:Uncharacterized protein n=1 Tax=Catenuloplanes nepalensis TaxID=587533 RepID=A0ABT9MJZ1_9ACTN|nr:hypothetical protein [Catenuloplanes nepalensis]MDP9791743.1 hypothetical protein [Catenuloplanes nepalensis]